jgi:glutamate-1-semialdehyde aminotransferase
MPSRNEAYLERALNRIPWGTQTNAKRHERDGMHHRPAFIKRASGCRMWDLDDRKYIDYRAALGPIILGYQYKEVDDAVRRQMDNGVLFSMASPIELEAAEALLETIAWAEQIRFMKTGADATTCCLRLARSRTGRDHFLTTGYHGYQDWYAIDWPKPGIPEPLRPYVHSVPYGDTAAVDRVFDAFGPELAAAVIVPIEWHLDPDPDWIRHLRRKCDAYGTALVFDEVLTGFRLDKGGAAAAFGIQPDMAAYAKALANGYPVSAYAGTREWMGTLDQTIITTTYAGETLSLAAVCAVMDIFRREPVHEHIWRLGAMLRKGFGEIFTEAGLSAGTIGVDPGFVITYNLPGEEAEALHIRLFNALYKRGIFANEQWFITYSHQEEDIDRTLATMRECIREVV